MSGVDELEGIRIARMERIIAVQEELDELRDDPRSGMSGLLLCLPFAVLGLVNLVLLTLVVLVVVWADSGGFGDMALPALVVGATGIGCWVVGVRGLRLNRDLGQRMRRLHSELEALEAGGDDGDPGRAPARFESDPVPILEHVRLTLSETRGELRREGGVTSALATITPVALGAAAGIYLGDDLMWGFAVAAVVLLVWEGVKKLWSDGEE